MGDAATQTGEVFRRESGRILATLISICGSFDEAEEAMQEAFAAALGSWQQRGIPNNPAAWITTVAHRKLIDQARRRKTWQEKQGPVEQALSAPASSTGVEPDEAAMNFPDERLRLLFTCCHPALNREAQVALTLRTLCGLTTPEIARAFLVPEATLAQRIVRAKHKIRAARIPYQVPPPEVLPERLAGVQAVIYLVFNEGYVASSGEQLVREGMTAEAIRLARMLRQLMPGEAENTGLLALLLLQDSRRRARTGADGQLILLDEQDRALWDREAITEGLELLEQALRMRAPGPYQLQAAIAALHAEAQTAADTDWAQIAALYQRLMEFTPSPVVALNHAVAVAMSEGPERGLALMDGIGEAGDLRQYHLFHAARADLLRRLGRKQEARQAYEAALALATNGVERNYLLRRLSGA